MVKRTTINLDAELVAQAREALNAKNTTDTVHAALRDVVRRQDLRSLTEWELEDLTLESIKEMRRARVETRSWGRWRDEFDLGDSSQGVREARESSEPERPAKHDVSSRRRKASVKRGRAATG
jgi:Arc/MetJ family transcription regulator